MCQPTSAESNQMPIVSVKWVDWSKLIFSLLLLSLLSLSYHLHLPAEQFHEVLEAVLSEKVKGALGWAEMDQQEDEEDDGEKWNQKVPASSQDVVPLGLVWTLLGQLQVTLSLLVPGLNRHTQRIVKSFKTKESWKLCLFHSETLKNTK